MKQVSRYALAFSLLLLFCLLSSVELFATTPPGPPPSGNAPLPAVWVLAVGGAALGIYRVHKRATDQ